MHHPPSNPIRENLSNEVVDRSECDGHALESERAESMPGVSLAYGLLADEVGDHGAGRLEDGADVAELRVLTTKVVAHLHMTSGRLVSGMLGHGDGAFVVAKQDGRFALPETEVAQQHAEIEGFLGAFCLSAILGLLGGQTHCG